MCRLAAVSGDDGLVSRNTAPRTMSGGEPSSIKRTAVCAVRVPDLSWLLQHRAYRISRGRVCSLAKDRTIFSVVR